MKLTEIHADPIQHGKEIDRLIDYMKKVGVPDGNYDFDDDSSINVYHQGIEIDTHWLNKDGKLPVKFDVVDGKCYLRSPNLTSFVGFPKKCKTFTGSSALVTSLEGCPKHVTGDFIINFCKKLTSLEGIADHIDTVTGALVIYPPAIKSGGLGILLIKDLKNLNWTTASSHEKPWVIIQQYLRQPDKIFECQNELIDAGCDEYAKL